MLKMLEQPRAFRLDDYRIRHTGGRVQHDLDVVKRSVRADGSVSISGGRDLKSTQAYPPAFGRAVEALQASHRSEWERHALSLRGRGVADKAAKAHISCLLAASRAPLADAWEDAGLEEVFRLLGL